MDDVDDVYEHALSIMREHPEACAVGTAWLERDGVVYACAGGCVILDRFGQPITGERIKQAIEDDVPCAGELQAIAAFRACKLAREILRQKIEEQE